VSIPVWTADISAQEGQGIYARERRRLRVYRRGARSAADESAPDTLRVIERESGLEGLLLRPLSARHFEPTIPEKEDGWIGTGCWRLRGAPARLNADG